MAQAHPVPQKAKQPVKKPAPRLQLVLDDPENASAVLRLLYSLDLYTQTEIAHRVGVSVSAVNEWLREPVTRPIPSKRWPQLAAVWGLPADGRTFGRPVSEVEKRIIPCIEAMEKSRREEAQKAIQALADMEGYVKGPVQTRLFEPGAGSDKLPGRHLQSV